MTSLQAWEAHSSFKVEESKAPYPSSMMRDRPSVAFKATAKPMATPKKERVLVRPPITDPN